MPGWLSPWLWTSDTWAGLQFGVLVIAALVAWRQVGEARRLREEQARPFVIIDLQVFSTIAEFKITNIGATIARDVRFEFTPELASTFDGATFEMPLAETALFKRGLPSLPPGKEITTLFDQLPTRFATELPDDYEVRISYSDPLGHRYAETMTVGMSALRDLTRINRKTIDDIHKQLENMVKEMKKWTNVTSALKVMTPDDLTRFNAQLRAEWEERRREHEKAKGGTSSRRLGRLLRMSCSSRRGDDECGRLRARLGTSQIQSF